MIDFVESQKKHKIIIIILLILICCSLVAIGGVQLIKKNMADNRQISVVVPDNIITPDEEESQKEFDQTDINDASDTESNADSNQQEATGADARNQINTNYASNTDASIEEIYAAALSLKKRQAEDNDSFAVTNMFPGDVEANYYCVNVSYKDAVTVRFGIEIQEGYEKLAEVLKVRVHLLTTDEQLYDGLMLDMPESINHEMYSNEETSEDLYYEITAYLETSVGNEYMEKALKADFKWWVEETGNLVSPETGDNSNMMFWVGALLISLCLLMLLLMKQKKEEQHYGE